MEQNKEGSSTAGNLNEHALHPHLHKGKYLLVPNIYWMQMRQMIVIFCIWICAQRDENGMLTKIARQHSWNFVSFFNIELLKVINFC